MEESPPGLAKYRSSKQHRAKVPLATCEEEAGRSHTGWENIYFFFPK